MIDQLRSFHRRRIAIPVGADALVLDVGSGDKPHWRADVLVDRFPDAEHAVQRSGRAAARTSRPLFDADVTAMPFADKSFDYVICSHLLEHVLDPAAAITEMVRVARAGYIEVPRAASAKVIDFASHLWWCRLDNGVLTFEAKSANAFDPEIESFVRKPAIEREMNRLIDKYLDDCVIALHWTDDVAFSVDGVADTELLAQVAAADVHHKSAETIVVRVLTALFVLRVRKRRRVAPVRFDDVVRPDLVVGDGAILQRRRYSVGATRS